MGAAFRAPDLGATQVRVPEAAGDPAVKSAVETLNPTRVKLTVEVPFDELKPSLDAAYKNIGAQVQIPGFRKGKVPARIIDQRFGRGAVLEEAVNEALPKFYGQAVEESEAARWASPRWTSPSADPATGGDLMFTAEVDVRPEVELPDFATLAVTVDDVVVDEADVEERVTALRDRFGTLIGVERAAATATSSPSTCRPDRRRGDRRGRPVSPTRSAPRHARRPRRGPHRPVRGRVHDLHRPAGRRRPRGPGRRRHRHRAVGQGARAPRGRTTTSPSWPASSTPSTS